MKKLRLLITQDCNRNCAKCCNKGFALEQLPVAESFRGYQEIILTGGEPLLKMDEVTKVMMQIAVQNPNAKIFLYTAKCDNSFDFPYLLFTLGLDGVTITLHKKEDVAPFVEVDALLEKFWQGFMSNPKSLRLNVFKGIELPSLRLHWKIKKDIVWLDNCPLPKDEVFMRLK